MNRNILPDNEILYRAFVDRDSSFEGIFYAAVKTTGIFCRPSCGAKKAKPENIEFFSTAADAIYSGYRPCRVCRPLESKGEFPDWMRPVIEKINDNPSVNLKSADLRALGIEPGRISRWFKTNLGMTFSAYLRSLRISKAIGQIRHGDKVIDTAYDSGYESLSGFTESFKKSTGVSPKESRGINFVTVTRLITPLGPMLAGATEKGICLLEFIDRKMLETQIAHVKKIFKAEIIPGESPFFEILNTELAEYFKGIRKSFTVPIVMDGTVFQMEAWKLLLKIPYGTTSTYKTQAESLGKALAIRAIAKANGDNRIAIIIPCHRIIGSDGKLVGYSGGIWRKQYLLNLEKNNL